MSAASSAFTIAGADAVPGTANRSTRIYARFLTAAAVAGALYTLSPMTMWFGVWMAVLFRWLAARADGTERRWVLAAFGTALAVRLAAIAVVPFVLDRGRMPYSAYFSDALYAIQRSIWIRNVALGVPIPPRDYIEAFEPEFGWSGYNYVLAYLHILFGPSPFGPALVSCGLFLVACALLYVVCRQGYGRLSAYCSLVVLLFVPSWLGWSVAPLKEAMQFFLLTVALLATRAIVGGGWTTRARAAAILTAVAVLSGTLRNGGTALVLIGAGAGVALQLITWRWWTAVAFAVLLPLAAVVASTNPVVRDVTAGRVNQAAARHAGHVRTLGFSYRILDAKFYASTALPAPGQDPNELSAGLSFDEGARFLIRAVVAFFVIPLPWIADSTAGLLIAPQQVLWYAVIALAAFGVIRGGRRDRLLTTMLVGFVVAAVVVVAPNSGNIGTLIRHRDMIVPFMLALAGPGGVALAAGRLRPDRTKDPMINPLPHQSGRVS